MHTQQNNLLERSTYLKIATSKFREYLRDCAVLKILDEIDVFKEDAEVSCRKCFSADASIAAYALASNVDQNCLL